MSAPTFTRGPLTVGYRSATTYTISVRLANGQKATIAACYGWPGEEGRAVDPKANAELFARAPEMDRAIRDEIDALRVWLSGSLPLDVAQGMAISLRKLETALSIERT